MAIITSPRLRVAIAIDFVPQAFGLFSAIVMTAVIGLFVALGVVTLMHGLTLDGWQAIGAAAVVFAECLGLVLTIEAAMDASVRLGRRVEAAALRWCERTDG
jgi:hypothetical protein